MLRENGWISLQANLANIETTRTEKGGALPKENGGYEHKIARPIALATF